MFKNAEQTCGDRKQRAAENLWLHYYNRALFEKGLISEQERNRMSALINSSRPISSPHMSNVKR